MEFECAPAPRTVTRTTSVPNRRGLGLAAGIGFNRRVPSDYRVSQPLLVRLLGSALAVLGLLVLLLALLVGLLDLPGWVLAAGLVVAVVLMLAGTLFLTRMAALVQLDDVGYRVRYLRGAGVAQARWKDVEDVVASTVADERCVVLRLRDGRSTVIPVRLLAARSEDFVQDLRAHLDAGHGYRRLR